MHMKKLTNLEYLRNVIIGGKESSSQSQFQYPPPIAKTLGFVLTEVGEGTATLEMTTNTDTQANPMGTIHGGVIGDLADAAIGTAHAASLDEGESFTTVDFQINFFRPIWNERIRAVAKPVHSGKTVSRYFCNVTKEDGKLVAQVTSTVTTLRGDDASGR
jgi:uncharacterized protein (TIGR00369 family)